jgi:hypothetical protein
VAVGCARLRRWRCICSPISYMSSARRSRFAAVSTTSSIPVAAVRAVRTAHARERPRSNLHTV